LRASLKGIVNPVRFVARVFLSVQEIPESGFSESLADTRTIRSPAL